MNKRYVMIRHSLSQRERIEVRDPWGIVFPRQSKLPEGRYRVLPGSDDSKSERQRFLVWPEIRPALCRGFREGGSCDLNHPIRWQVSRSDNRNPGCTDRWDAGAGIYSAQSFDFEDVTTVCVRIPSRFCGGNEHESPSDCLAIANSSEKINHSPLTSILSPQPGRGGHLFEAI